ncbi:MAG: YbaK/EbsC family protein [Anaerolineae bacterium]|nr:YbaK/EbsC family protein [Anaerolineae bacterium]
MEAASGDIWTPEHLQHYLDAHQIPAEIVRVEQHTPTVVDAAAALGVSVDKIVKTVVFIIADQPYAALANGVLRVDTRKLAARFGVNRKKVMLANAEQLISLTGYAPGTVPPLGHRQQFPTLMEPGILDQEVVYAGGGGIAEMLKIRSADLQRLTQPELLPLLETSLPTSTSAE